MSSEWDFGVFRPEDVFQTERDVSIRKKRLISDPTFGAVPDTAVPPNYNTGATRSGKAIRPKQADDTGFAPGAMLLPGTLALPGWPAKVAGTATGLIYSMAVTGSRPTPKQIEEAYIRGENANQYKPIDGSITSYTPTTEPDGVVTVQTQPIVQRLLLTNSGSAPEDPPEPARTTQNVGVSSFSSGGGGGGGGGPVGVVTGGGGGGGTDSCLICAVAAAGLALAIS